MMEPDETKALSLMQQIRALKKDQIVRRKEKKSRSRAAHRNRILRFVRYGCTGKTPVPSSPQTCELTAVILTAVNRIETVNFSRITASYGYTGACSVIS